MQHKWMERIRPRKPPGAFSPLLALVALRRLSNSMFTVADQDHVQDPFDLAEVRPTGERAAPPPDSMPHGSKGSRLSRLHVLSTKKSRL